MKWRPMTRQLLRAAQLAQREKTCMMRPPPMWTNDEVARCRRAVAEAEKLYAADANSGSELAQLKLAVAHDHLRSAVRFAAEKEQFAKLVAEKSNKANGMRRSTRCTFSARKFTTSCRNVPC
jgi:hypothetical protein